MLPFANRQSALGGDNELAWHNANHEYGHIGSGKSVISIAGCGCTRRQLFPCRFASTRPIEELPPDVRRVVGRWKSVCGFPLTARRSFVHYLGDRSLGYQFIALHFHDLSCDNKTAVCNDRGCLHQVYVSTGSTYRVVFTEYVQEVTLTFLDHTPAVEIECMAVDARCPRVLRWNGRRFERP